MADEAEVQAQEAIEKDARAMGWSPKEEWRGDPDSWADAKSFVERGRQIMPILQRNNERLLGTLRTAEARLQSMEQSLKAATTAIETLEASHDEDVKAQVAAAKADLQTELTEALRDGDHAAAAKLTTKLTELRDASVAAADDKGDNKGDEGQQRPTLHPEVRTWYEQNPDFLRNPRKVALANAVAAEFRSAGDARTGAAFLDAVAAEVDKTMGLQRRGGSSKVEGDNGGSGRRGDGGGAKSYADLPAEAKAVCDKQAARLVGPTRAHKDIDSWRKSYAKQYFSE